MGCVYNLSFRNGTVSDTEHRAVASDPSIYPDPERFIPERHIASISKDTENESADDADQIQLDPATYVFGFGRR